MDRTFACILIVVAFGCGEAESEAAPPVASPLPTEAPRSAAVEVGPEGVEVAQPSRRVRVGAGGVAVREDGRSIQIGAGGVRVQPTAPVAVAPATAAPRANALSQLVEGAIAEAQGAAPGALVCDGSQRIVRNGATLDGGRGPAIVASGSCEVVCNACRLRSDRLAVSATGSARVVLNQSQVDAPVAIDASGSAHVVSNLSAIRGRTVRSGNAHVVVN